MGSAVVTFPGWWWHHTSRFHNPRTPVDSGTVVTGSDLISGCTWHDRARSGAGGHFAFFGVWGFRCLSNLRPEDPMSNIWVSVAELLAVRIVL